MNQNKVKDLDTAIEILQKLREEYGNLSVGKLKCNDESIFVKVDVLPVEASVVNHPEESSHLLVIFD